MNEYRLSPRASDDLRSIWQVVAADSQINADALIDRILDSLDFLARNPVNGDPWPHGPQGMRCHTTPGTKYVIFFVPAPDGIDVLRVTHGSQDLDALRFR